MSYYTDIMKYGSCEIRDTEEFEVPRMVTLTREEWVEICKRLDREVIAASKTKIWINRELPESKQYKPTDREKPYIVGEIK